MNTSTPLVSILVPTWNRARVISRTIRSALNQSYKNVEIIVTDNASSDGTADIAETIAREDSRVRIYRNEKNIGPIPNWRLAFELSSGKYIKFLWSDDFLEPTTVEELLRPLLTEKEIGFTICPAIVESAHGVLRRSDFSRLPEITIWSLLTSRVLGYPWLPVSPAAGLIRREIVKASLEVSAPLLTANGFEKRGIGRDLIILYFALALGFRGRKVTSTWVHFWDGDDSITHNTPANEMALGYAYAMGELLRYIIDNGAVDPYILHSRLVVLVKTRSLLNRLRGKPSSMYLMPLQDYMTTLPTPGLISIICGYFWVMGILPLAAIRRIGQ